MIIKNNHKTLSFYTSKEEKNHHYQSDRKPKREKKMFFLSLYTHMRKEEIFSQFPFFFNEKRIIFSQSQFTNSYYDRFTQRI